VMLALPMSPLVENLMPSLVTEMTTVSPMPLRSLQRRQGVTTRHCRVMAFYSGSKTSRHPCITAVMSAGLRVQRQFRNVIC